MNKRSWLKIVASLPLAGIVINKVAAKDSFSINYWSTSMEHVSGNIFVREMKFEKALESVEGHTHNFDHTTYVVRGGLRIEQLGENGEVLRAVEKHATQGHNWVLIKANIKHRITALEDNSLGHCIYSHRTPQGEIVQEYDGWQPAFV